MAGESSVKARAWPIFDRIVGAAPAANTNPWKLAANGRACYEPDTAVLSKLLGVPLHLKAVTQSGVPALALDVWLSYELRRAGFDADAVWPRPVPPRVLPATIVHLLRDLPAKQADLLRTRINRRSAIPGVSASTASILGKNYIKQVDVVMSDWASGPELLISTKRMDSSYGKNAPNRIEESYGDAKNLRLRHPLAALGFVFGLRSEILQKEPLTAEWLIDLLKKLGCEDDAYHATCLVMMEYDDSASVSDSGEEEPAAIIEEPGLELDGDGGDGGDGVGQQAESQIDQIIKQLPEVRILDVHEALSPGRFLEIMVQRVLNATPVTMHKLARLRRAEIQGNEEAS